MNYLRIEYKPTKEMRFFRLSDSLRGYSENKFIVSPYQDRLAENNIALFTKNIDETKKIIEEAIKKDDCIPRDVEILEYHSIELSEKEWEVRSSEMRNKVIVQLEPIGDVDIRSFDDFLTDTYDVSSLSLAYEESNEIEHRHAYYCMNYRWAIDWMEESIKAFNYKVKNIIIERVSQEEWDEAWEED